MKKMLTLSVLSFVLVVWGCQAEKDTKAATKKSGTTTLKTEDDKVFYTIGTMFGGRLKNLSPTNQEMEALFAGLRDVAQGKEPQVDTNEYQQKVQSTFQERMKLYAEKVKKEGATYLENFIKKEGGKKTESGLAYKIIKEGTGKKPKPTDTVEVHYHGTLIDGTVFDSSVDRKKKVEFPLNRVVKGWTEGLQLIKEGGKIQLVIPSELAYGEQGAPPKIPGGATLVFDVELFTIKNPPEPKTSPTTSEATKKSSDKTDKTDKKDEPKKKVN